MSTYSLKKIIEDTLMQMISSGGAMAGIAGLLWGLREQVFVETVTGGAPLITDGIYIGVDPIKLSSLNIDMRARLLYHVGLHMLDGDPPIIYGRGIYSGLAEAVIDPYLRYGEVEELVDYFVKKIRKETGLLVYTDEFDPYLEDPGILYGVLKSLCLRNKVDPNTILDLERHVVPPGNISGKGLDGKTKNPPEKPYIVAMNMSRRMISDLRRNADTQSLFLIENLPSMRRPKKTWVDRIRDIVSSLSGEKASLILVIDLPGVTDEEAEIFTGTIKVAVGEAGYNLDIVRTMCVADTLCTSYIGLTPRYKEINEKCRRSGETLMTEPMRLVKSMTFEAAIIFTDGYWGDEYEEELLKDAKSVCTKFRKPVKKGFFFKRVIPRTVDTLVVTTGLEPGGLKDAGWEILFFYEGMYNGLREVFIKR